MTTISHSRLFRHVAACALALCLSLGVSAQISNLLPRPQRVVTKAGEKPLKIRGEVRLETAVSPRLERAVSLLTGLQPSTSRHAASLTIAFTDSIAGAYDYTLAGYDNEAYHLRVSSKGISIEAVTETGVIRALQTLGQLLGDEASRKTRLQACDIVDWPAFKLRGWMHDCGRSYIETDELKQEIRLLSRFKLNTLHLHLTENQAWRFESRNFPQLTADSTMTRHEGLSYSQAELRELASMAALYGITIIPEIDVPGHSDAFERAMGHTMQTDQAIGELKQIFDEVLEVFPDAPYIHIGGDEKTITYPRFLQIMIEHIHSRGKKVIVWNPIRGTDIGGTLETDMTQMWSSSGRIVPGIPNIDCRYYYANHFDTFADIVGIYRSNIYYAERGSHDLAGSIVAFWNDRKLDSTDAILCENGFYPSLLAMAERAWCGGGKAYIEKLGTALPVSGEEYEEFADWERRFLFHKDHSLRNQHIAYVRQSDIRWRITTNRGATVQAAGGGIYLRHTWGGLVSALFDNPQPGDTAIAETQIYSPTDQTAGALIEMQNYSRSERDLAPPPGKWDYRGSRVFLNGEELLPPAWLNAGKNMTHETPQLNENLASRPPLPVKLHQGWNNVRIVLPYIQPQGIRLNKWMFTFVLTTPDGRHALDGIRYSTERFQLKEVSPIPYHQKQ